MAEPWHFSPEKITASYSEKCPKLDNGLTCDEYLSKYPGDDDYRSFISFGNYLLL